ncbi:MAG: hypothetical protein LKI92_12890 [Schleiferilactobacillus harbinensis]|nr:hypothetical protein [Schleiferilactobacillus harbinensis]MCI1913012.1 hypothetical protein [Schleiferilactobacillus harbinensis]
MDVLAKYWQPDSDFIVVVDVDITRRTAGQKVPLYLESTLVSGAAFNGLNLPLTQILNSKTQLFHGGHHVQLAYSMNQAMFADQKSEQNPSSRVYQLSMSYYPYYQKLNLGRVQYGQQISQTR